MTFEKGKSYKTADGDEAVYLGMDKEGDYMFALIDGVHTEVFWYNGDGESITSGVPITTEPYTEPRKGEVWVNVYDDGDVSAHESLKDARDFHRMAIPQENKCIARKRIEWTEGEYDE